MDVFWESSHLTFLLATSEDSLDMPEVLVMIWLSDTCPRSHTRTFCATVILNFEKEDFLNWTGSVTYPLSRLYRKTRKLTFREVEAAEMPFHKPWLRCAGWEGLIQRSFLFLRRIPVQISACAGPDPMVGNAHWPSWSEGSPSAWTGWGYPLAWRALEILCEGEETENCANKHRERSLNLNERHREIKQQRGPTEEIKSMD